MPELINPDKASELLDLSPQWIRKLLQKGDIEGQKLGRNWVITREVIEAYKEKKKEAETSK